MTSSVDLRAALQIQGFMSSYELEWLARRAREHRVIVEIGSWRGRSTRAMADNTDGKIYAIDLWLPYEPLKHFTDGQPEKWLFDEFWSNTSHCLNVIPWQEGSVVAAHKWNGDPRPDMVFIDGDHLYETVREDILAWGKLLIPGGLLSGHDFHDEDVCRAVNELCTDIDNPSGLIWTGKLREAYVQEKAETQIR